MAATGDVAAFEALYDATASRVYGLALRILRSGEEAEAVTRQCYLEIWHTAARFDPARGSAMTWIIAVVHGRAVERARSDRAGSTPIADAGGGELSERPPFHHPPRDAVPSSLGASRVLRALSGLSTAQHEALALAYFGGYTHAELTGLLGGPLDLVPCRLRGGLIRFRDRMERP